MNQLTVIIPSKTASNLRACVAALRTCEPTVRVIAIDDFEEGSRPQEDVVWVPGVKPFIWSRAVNSGIKAAGSDDVCLLNDDALLQTSGGLTMAQAALDGHQDYGLLAAMVNGKKWQEARGGIHDALLMVPFVCVVIPRRTIDELQELLDERFSGYGYDDDDYCLRVRRAGLKVGTFMGCRVNHKTLPSTYRAVSQRPPGMDLNRAIFCDKWGAHPL